VTDFMENGEYFGITSDREKLELIEIIQHFCYWCYERKFTSSRLTILWVIRNINDIMIKELLIVSIVLV
jgi:hypothetical protein